MEFQVNDPEGKVNDLEFAFNGSADPTTVTNWKRLSQLSLQGWSANGLPLLLAGSVKNLNFEQLVLKPSEAVGVFDHRDAGPLYIHARSVNQFNMASGTLSKLVAHSPRAPTLLTADVPSVFANEFLILQIFTILYSRYK